MKGNLNDKGIELMEIQRILEDVGRVLKNMHQKGFVHFDISPGNFNQKTFYIKLKKKNNLKNPN